LLKVALKPQNSKKIIIHIYIVRLCVVKDILR
jgi:hypothetical protein